MEVRVSPLRRHRCCRLCSSLQGRSSPHSHWWNQNDRVFPAHSPKTQDARLPWSGVPSLLPPREIARVTRINRTSAALLSGRNGRIRTSFPRPHCSKTCRWSRWALDETSRGRSYDHTHKPDLSPTDETLPSQSVVHLGWRKGDSP